MKQEKRLENEIAGIKSGLIVSALRSVGVVLNDKVIDTLPYLITEAIDKYDPERGASLETWVYSYIQFRIHRFLKNQLVLKSIEASNSYDKDGNNCNYLNNIASDVDVEKTVLVKSVFAAVEKLEGKEKVAMQHFLKAVENNTQNTFKAQLARDLNMSREGARKLVKRSMEKLQASLRG